MLEADSMQRSSKASGFCVGCLPNVFFGFIWWRKCPNTFHLFAIILCFHHFMMKLLLIQRKNEPCKGKWAFPGGFMDIDETTIDAARRELKEETGLVVGELHQSLSRQYP